MPFRDIDWCPSPQVSTMTAEARTMRTRFGSALVIAAVCGSGIVGRAQEPSAAGRPYTGPRTGDGKPTLNGTWQAMRPAHWALGAHAPAAGPPAGMGVGRR